MFLHAKSLSMIEFISSSDKFLLLVILAFFEKDLRIISFFSDFKSTLFFFISSIKLSIISFSLISSRPVGIPFITIEFFPKISILNPIDLISSRISLII